MKAQVCKLAGVLLLVAGCARAANQPPAPVTMTTTTPYYPLDVGNTWVYKGTDHELTMKVTKHEKIGGTICALMETRIAGEVTAREHLSVTQNGVFRVAANGKKLSAPLPVLKLPPKQGTSWTVHFVRQGRKSVGSYRMGEEEVTVPAGKYQAVKMEGDVSEEEKRTLVFEYWFAPEVGMVKQILRSPGQAKTYELLRFERAQ